MLDAQPAANAPARPLAIQPLHTIPRDCRYHGRPLQACRVAGRGNSSASRAGGGSGARSKDPARSHERGLRRQRHARRLGLEGRLRSGRSRDGAVHPALRPSHAPRGGRRPRIRRLHARHAGDPRGAGAVPDKAVGGTACLAAVLHSPYRSPTPRCKPPPSAPATSCWSPRRAPACLPSWPNAPSASTAMACDRGIPCT